MEINGYCRAVLDVDHTAIVLCNLDHTIIYMNPYSISRYHGDLTGKNLLECHNADSQEKILKVVEWFKKSPENNVVFTFHNERENKDVYMIALRDEAKNLVGYYEKHEYRNLETRKPYQDIL